MSLTAPSVNRSQHGLELIGNRLEEYRKIRPECLVIAFRDDLIAPPVLCREVADHIPGCRYEEIAGCGHYGYLEQPEKANRLLIDYFAVSESRSTGAALQLNISGPALTDFSG